jgi:uncharacterized membrane protein HdeD (DUF308 family)
MREAMNKNWWVWLLRGIFAILFGILAILFPGEAFAALIYIFGAYVLVDGAMTIYNALSHRGPNWGWELLEGVIAILAGLAAFFMTGLAGLTIILVIGVWAIITGVLQVVAAWRLRQEIDNEIWLGLAGILSVIMGILFIRNPFGGALATVWLIGIYSIVFGVMFMMLAFRVRNMDDTSNLGEPQTA